MESASMTKAADESIFDQYVRHAEVLRNWFIGYGIGGVVLFVGGQSVVKSVPIPEIVPIAVWLILGVSSQVVLAFLNKVYNFVLYYSSTKADQRGVVQNVHRRNLIMFLCIDVPLDLVTLVSFVVATCLLVKLLLTIAA
jgi:hypothetical protein